MSGRQEEKEKVITRMISTEIQVQAHGESKNGRIPRNDLEYVRQESFGTVEMYNMPRAKKADANANGRNLIGSTLNNQGTCPEYRSRTVEIYF